MSAAAGLFALGCAVSALAPAMPEVLAGRILQGLGGGGLVSIGADKVEKVRWYAAMRALRADSSLKVRAQAAIILGQRGATEAVGAAVLVP